MFLFNIFDNILLLSESASDESSSVPELSVDSLESAEASELSVDVPLLLDVSELEEVSLLLEVEDELAYAIAFATAS